MMICFLTSLKYTTLSKRHSALRFVHLRTLSKRQISQLSSTVYQEIPSGKFLVCPVFENMIIEREKESKWYVDNAFSELFMEEHGPARYPSFCTGYYFKKKLT